jgi:6-phosphofructokinase 1
MEAVEKTKAVAKAMADKDFEQACELRGAGFVANLQTQLQLSKIKPKLSKESVCAWLRRFWNHYENKIEISPIKTNEFNFAVINIGAPACGVNSCIRSFTRHGISKGCKIYAILDGFDGLVKGQVSVVCLRSNQK